MISFNYLHDFMQTTIYCKLIIIIDYINGGLNNILPQFKRIFYIFILYLIDGFWILFNNLVQLTCLILCIGISVVLISYFKSLQSRYYFYSNNNVSFQTDIYKDNEEEGNDIKINGKNITKQNYKNNTSPFKSSMDDLLYIAKSYQSTSIRFKLSKIPIIGKLFQINRKDLRERRHCSKALTNSDVRLLYKQLSWCHTSIDFERVNWFNTIIRTFWPAIKVQVNKFVINDLLKPKQRLTKLPNISRNLAKDKAKLSVYISCRRNMDALYESRKKEDNFYKQMGDSLKRSVIYMVYFFSKLFLIYTKQFVMDYIKYLIKSKEQKNERETIIKNMKSNCSIDRCSSPSSSTFSINSTENDKAKNQSKPKSFAGFGTNNRTLNVIQKKKKNAKSAPSRIMHHSNTTFNPLGHTLMSNKNKFKSNRLRLAKTFLLNAKNQMDNEKTNNELIVERLKLGNSIPVINGVKYIEKDEQNKDHEACNDDDNTCLKVPSDNNNMRFLIELEYNTDEEFSIILNSLGILNQINLNNICFRVRLLLNINHTTTELNKNLDILDTPGDILFPSINHIQLTLVDLPTLDWNLKRTNKYHKIIRKKSINRRENKLLLFLNEYFDPINLINHNYFKYLIHSIIYCVLKWFQPFDIKIGSNFYLKSIC